MPSQLDLVEIVTRFGTFLIGIGIVAVLAVSVMERRRRKAEGDEVPKRFPEK